MAKHKISKETYIKWYEMMQLVRKFQDQCYQLYHKQKIKGFLHLYNGQEAILAGTYSVLTPQDSVITAYRDHGDPIAAGIHPKYILAELYGKTTGVSKGKGGSMHMFSKEKRFFGGHGIVGGQIPLGAGIAFAELYNGTKNVCLCKMGDGAVRQGALHETFNMAMLWKLPVIFMVENNGYAMGTSLERTTNVTDMTKIGLAYDMPSENVNGMKPETVMEAMQKATDRARRGDGPTFLVVNTYRYRGHSMSDAQAYRTKEELEDYKKVDPVEYVRNLIIDKKYVTNAQIEAIDQNIKQQIDEALTFAEESPLPNENDFFTDIYMQKDYPFITD